MSGGNEGRPGLREAAERVLEAWDTREGIGRASEAFDALRTALRDHRAIGLTLAEMDEIIDGNITITDSRLRDGVYGVVLDTEMTLLEKNALLPVDDEGVDNT